MRKQRDGVTQLFLFDASLGAAVFLMEICAALLLSPAFRQLIVDLPLLKLLWQTTLVLGLYLLTSVMGGELIGCILSMLFSKKARSPLQTAALSRRLFLGIVLFLYAFFGNFRPWEW